MMKVYPTGLFQTKNGAVRKLLLKLRGKHRRFQERMSKLRFQGGTVGAYFLLVDVNHRWRTLIHRRAMNMPFGGKLATPGGGVDKQEFNSLKVLRLDKSSKVLKLKISTRRFMQNV